MNRSLGKRGLMYLLVMLVMGYSLIPTFTNWSPTPEQRATQTLPWYKRMLPEKKISLGLDLQGGAHLVLGLDLEKVIDEATETMSRSIAEDLKSKNIPNNGFERASTDKKSEKYQQLVWKFATTADRDAAEDIIAKRHGNAEFIGRTDTTLIVRLSQFYAEQTKKRAVDQSIQTIRNRIDEFGVREPQISRQGDDRISVQFPGIQDPERLKRLIGQTAKLEFKLVSEKVDPKTLEGFVEEAKKAGIVFVEGTDQRFSDYLKKLNEFLAGKLPDGTELAFQKKIDPNTRESSRIPFLLEKATLLSGEHLDNAFVSFEQQFNKPEVNMSMTPAGAAIFAEVTGANVGRSMAIVLDGNVHSAPVIRSKIPDGNARIEMGGARTHDETLKDAEDTALVLRAGSLPTTLDFLEERTVGPSLGQDSIESGKIAMLIAMIGVVIFMTTLYGVAGLIADIAVALNLLCIMGLLAIFDAALTLPGIAGIALTVGMAVDGNIIIYERIREELARRASVTAAIEEGFKRSMAAILDSNITTLISGIVLYQFGTGSIKGFAVTLSIGILTTVFTVVFVSRYLCDLYIKMNGGTKFSVG